MRKRSNINNLCYLNTSTVDSSDSRFTTITRTLNVYLHLSQTKIISYLSTILSCHLSCVRSVLLRASETHLTS